MRKFRPVALNKELCELFDIPVAAAGKNCGIAMYRVLSNGKYEFNFAIYELESRKAILYGFRDFTADKNKKLRDIIETYGFEPFNVIEDTCKSPINNCDSNLVDCINKLYFNE